MRRKLMKQAAAAALTVGCDCPEGKAVTFAQIMADLKR